MLCGDESVERPVTLSKITHVMKTRRTKALPKPLKPINLTKYKGQWLALDPDTHEVVGHGRSLRAAERQAAAKGLTRPVFFGVPESDGYYV